MAFFDHTTARTRQTVDLDQAERKIVAQIGLRARKSLPTLTVV